jgi:hypothetical protein
MLLSLAYALLTVGLYTYIRLITIIFIAVPSHDYVGRLSSSSVYNMFLDIQ